MSKLVFKKRCPYCKSISFGRIHRKFWMRLIPTIKSYHCNNCTRNFITVFEISDIFERRACQRFQIRNGISVKFSPHFPKVDSFLDISNGGLSFRYITDKKTGEIPLNRMEKLEIIHNADDLCIKEIPFKVRWALESDDKFSVSKKDTKMCGIEFVNLTRKRRSQLQSFMQEYRQN